MARFKFSLQNVLDIREKMETQAKQEFAEATAFLQKQQDQLAALLKKKEDIRLEGTGLRQGILDFRKMKDNELAGKICDQKITEQKATVSKAEKQLELARKKMAEAVTSRKTYEKLKEKAFEEFLAEESRAESKVVDELTSYTYGQKGKDNG